MLKTGINYLKGNTTSDWWKLKGTEMAEVYGEENLPQIAGLLAATFPVSDVPRNVSNGIRIFTQK